MQQATGINLLLLLLWLCPALAWSQQLVADEPAPLKRYTVELVLFTYEENVGLGSEIFAPDAPAVPVEPEEADEVGYEEPGRETPPETEPLDDPIDIELALLATEDLALTDVVDRLNLLDAYEPVMHVGWTQAAPPEADSSPVPLTTFTETPDGLQGSFTLYLERFLHLVVDLAMDAPPQKIRVAFDDDRPAYELDGSDRGSLPVYYRIQEDRIVKNGELRYFDHPKFGVIAKVTRVAEDENDDRESGTDPLISRSLQ